jgi:hypothetical protein
VDQNIIWLIQWGWYFARRDSHVSSGRDR